MSEDIWVHNIFDTWTALFGNEKHLPLEWPVNSISRFDFDFHVLPALWSFLLVVIFVFTKNHRRRDVNSPHDDFLPSPTRAFFTLEMYK